MRAGNALLIALIENHVALGHDFIRGVVHGNFVRLQTVSADARIDVSFADGYARFFWSRYRFLVTSYLQAFG